MVFSFDRFAKCRKRAEKNPITSRFFIDFQCATSAQKSTCTHSDRKRISTLQQLKLLTTFFHRFYYPIFGQCKREAVFSICTIFNFIRTSLENACNKCSNFIETKNRIWRRIEFERFEMRRNQIRSLNGMIDIYANVESIHTCFRHCTQFTRREHFNACIKKKTALRLARRCDAVAAQKNPSQNDAINLNFARDIVVRLT